MSKLTGKVAVVTGGSKGIGAAIAKSLAAEGASVIVNYASSKAGADAVVSAITTAGGKALAVRGDVSKATDAQGLIDAAVNNSGVYEFSPIESFTEEQFHKIFNINVLGLLLTTQAAVPHLGEGASIINIGSVVSSLTPPCSTVYTGTKGAVDAISGVLAKDLGARKIRVNSINPGMVETDVYTPRVSSVPTSRRRPSRKLHSAVSARSTTSPASLPSLPRTMPSGSPASWFAWAVASANRGSHGLLPITTRQRARALTQHT